MVDLTTKTQALEKLNSNATEAGADPDQGHLRKHYWASDIGWSKPEVVSSMGAGMGADPDQGDFQR